jgi:hypothetical protein
MRLIPFSTLIVILAAAGLTGCAAPDAGPVTDPKMRNLASGQCLSRPLDDTRVLDDRTLLARDYSGRGAVFHMSAPCMQVNEAVIMRYYGGGPLCGALDVDIAGTSGGGMIPTHCSIVSVTPLSKAEAQQMFNGSGRKS